MQTKKKIRRNRIHRKRYILTSFGIAGAMTAVGATSHQATVHADTTQNQNQVQGVKQYPDKEIIDRTVDQAKGQEGLNIHKTGDETLPAENQADAHKQATDNYNQQSQKVNQAKDQAKQQMDAYHQDHNNWDKEKQKFDQDTEKYNQDLNKYNQDKATNEQKNKEIDNNNAEIDRENAAARNKYQRDLDKYNQAQSATDAHNAQVDKDNAAAQQKYREKLASFASWKASHNISGNVVSTADVNQQLILGHEPNAQHQINYVAPQLKVISVSDAGINFDAPAAGAYSTSQSINGEVFQITYTNLTNSSYTDSNGVKHKIAKIVFTYSDLSHNNLRENGLSTFVTYNDPAQGFWYNGSNGVTVQMV